jgi:transcriptional regulator with XRE-family HTH domain
MAKLNDPKNLGDFILATRKRQKLTQEDLALASGVGLRFLRELEKGKETCQFGRI